VTSRLEKYTSSDTSSAGCGSGLVDLLVAGGRVLGAHVDVGVDLVELEVVRIGEELDEVELVLGVTGVRDTLDARTLVGVVSWASSAGQLTSATE
jgi:hypothetical protein